MTCCSDRLTAPAAATTTTPSAAAARSSGLHRDAARVPAVGCLSHVGAALHVEGAGRRLLGLRLRDIAAGLGYIPLWHVTVLEGGSLVLDFRTRPIADLVLDGAAVGV